MRVGIKWAVIILRGVCVWGWGWGTVDVGDQKKLMFYLRLFFVTVLQLIGGVTARYNSLQVRCFQMLEMFNYFLWLNSGLSNYSPHFANSVLCMFVSESSNQSINQSIDQSIDRSIYQSIDQSIDQPIDQSIQSFNLPKMKSAIGWNIRYTVQYVVISTTNTCK